MTGSVMDGEDLVQESLFQAYRKLDTFDDERALSPWLFRIRSQPLHRLPAPPRRSSGGRDGPGWRPDFVPPANPSRPRISDARFEYLVIALPPKERACVLLKDVFDYTLEEIAELVDSTPGGVKAALSRGRQKLASLPKDAAPPRAASEALSRLLHLYGRSIQQARLGRAPRADQRRCAASGCGFASRGGCRTRRISAATRGLRIGGWRSVTSMASWRSSRCARNGVGWVPQSAGPPRHSSTSRSCRVVDYVHCPGCSANARVVGMGDSGWRISGAGAAVIQGIRRAPCTRKTRSRLP